MDLTGSASSNWDYLLAKYDRDGDRRIEAREYDRERARFDLLDHDADGTLTEADFPELDSASFRGSYRDQRAERVLAAHFQADDDNAELRLDELEWMITTYDTDLDETLDAREFAAGPAQNRRELDDGDASGTERAMMGTYEPWEVLLEAVDQNGDGRLGATELVAFFQLRCLGGEVLSLRKEGEGARTDSSGVPLGEPAPDFSLEPPRGGSRVPLSSFRGEKPVALIFGSFT